MSVTTVERISPRLTLAELRKIRTTNLWWILLLCGLVALALALLFNGFQGHAEIDAASSGNQTPLTEGGIPGAQRSAAARIFTSGSYFGQLIVLVLGALLVTNEFAHQTATSTFLAVPQRTRVIVAKLLATTSAAVAAWVLTTAISLVVGILYFASTDVPNSLGEWQVQRSILMNLLAYVIWAVLGVGLGALLRNQIAAIVTATAGYLIGTQLVQVVFYLLYLFVVKQTWILQLQVLAPSVASEVMVSAERALFGATTDGVPIFGPPWWVGTLVLIGYGVIMGGVGTLILRKRDIS
jgi:ABC-type transport system involved in multi-copper enzyme maturation permease subunit